MDQSSRISMNISMTREQWELVARFLSQVTNEYSETPGYEAMVDAADLLECRIMGYSEDWD